MDCEGFYEYDVKNVEKNEKCKNRGTINVTKKSKVQKY